MKTADTRNTTPAPTCTTFVGSSANKPPAATAMALWTVKASAVPRNTGRARYRVARTRAASAVLSGSSATKITAKTERKIA